MSCKFCESNTAVTSPCTELSRNLMKALSAFSLACLVVVDSEIVIVTQKIIMMPFQKITVMNRADFKKWMVGQ